MTTGIMTTEDVLAMESAYADGSYPDGYYRFIQETTEMALAAFISRWSGKAWRDISVSVAFSHEALMGAKSRMDAVLDALDAGEDPANALTAFCGQCGGVSDGVSVSDAAPDELRRLASTMSSLLGAAAERAASEARGEPPLELKLISG